MLTGLVKKEGEKGVDRSCKKREDEKGVDRSCKKGG